MKKLIPFLLAIFMLLGTHVSLGATSTELSSAVVVKPDSYQTISGGQCKIVNNGDGTINISGSTSAYYAVEKIGLKLSLQYLSGGKWCASKSYSYAKYNASSVSGGQLLSVSGGYYYRVVGQHSSLNGSVSESGQSYSESIYIQ